MNQTGTLLDIIAEKMTEVKWLTAILLNWTTPDKAGDHTRTNIVSNDVVSKIRRTEGQQQILVIDNEGDVYQVSVLRLKAGEGRENTE